jgi:predicted porin
MQKKLIALAVAGFISAPVMAQSNVQIYGVVDLGVRHLSGGESVVPGGSPKSRLAVDHSGQVASRLGFRGTEDLGNGLKAFFTVEQALTPDTTSAPGNRQAFVGLEGDFGRFWMGRDFNPSRAFTTGLDPFTGTGIGSNQNVNFQDTRFDNGVFYRTPSFSGLTVTIAATNRTSGNEQSRFSGVSDPNRRGITVTPMYRNGPIMVAGGYEKYSRAGDETRWNLGGSYDFGVANVRAFYSRNKNKTFVGNPTSKTWFLGATAPLGEAGTLLASFVRNKVDVSGGSDPRANQLAVGYSHAMSKRTHLYATYANISTNSAGEGRFSLDRAASWNSVNSGGPSYERGLNVGLRHSF